MARLMCVATHHKAGTVWMRRLFKVIAMRINVPWYGVWTPRHADNIPKEGRCFLFNWHGTFPDEVWQRDDVAFFHVVRDPRDILISGAHYHLDAPEEGERWLHAPRPDLGGVTYQQHLRSLPSYEDRLLFEMDGKHAETVAEMRAWPWGDPRIWEDRYESLIDSRRANRFRKMLRHLGLSEDEAYIGLRAFWTHSVFGRLYKSPMTTDRVKRHIRSAATKRFRTEMPRAIGEQYAERFNDDLINLGYTKGARWVRDLPEQVATETIGKMDET